jgi:hypothetical protein
MPYLPEHPQSRQCWPPRKELEKEFGTFYIDWRFKDFVSYLDAPGGYYSRFNGSTQAQTGLPIHSHSDRM